MTKTRAFLSSKCRHWTYKKTHLKLPFHKFHSVSLFLIIQGKYLTFVNVYRRKRENVRGVGNSDFFQNKILILNFKKSLKIEIF